MKKPVTFLGLLLLLSSGLMAEETMKNIKFKGSLRYRVERIDKEGSEIRNRHRFQAKLSASAKVNDNISAKIGLVSGSDDPVSTNQTAGDSKAFTSKDLMLDEANIKLTLGNSHLLLGKAKNIMFVPSGSELIWDGDLRPEGIQGHTHYSLWESGKIAHNLGLTYVDENSSTKDIYLYGFQTLLEQKIADSKLNIGFSLFSYDNTANQGTLYDGKLFGNSDDSLGNYKYGYQIMEFFAQYNFTAMETPLALAFDYAKNGKVDADDTAWLVGLKAGKAKEVGEFDFALNYRKVEKDSLLGVFTDSDFKGGGTDGKGLELAVKYMLFAKTSLSLTHFINDTSLDAATKRSYDRTQLDLKASF